MFHGPHKGSCVRRIEKIKNDGWASDFASLRVPP